MVNTLWERDGNSSSNCDVHRETGQATCGGCIQSGQLVLLWGEDIHLVRGDVWYIGVYTLSANTVNHSLVTGCKVGVVKTVVNQLAFFQNRVGITGEVRRSAQPHQDSKSRGRSRDTPFVEAVRGAVDIVFVDGPYSEINTIEPDPKVVEKEKKVDGNTISIC